MALGENDGNIQNKLIETMLELSWLSFRTRLFGSHGFAKVCRSLALNHKVFLMLPEVEG